MWDPSTWECTATLPHPLLWPPKVSLDGYIAFIDPYSGGEHLDQVSFLGVNSSTAVRIHRLNKGFVGTHFLPAGVDTLQRLCRILG